MVQFSPPTWDGVPPLLPTTTGLQRRLFRHYKNRAVGHSILKIGGVYYTIDTPTQEQIDSSTEYYAGGHIYDVGPTVAVALSDAGYPVGSEPATYTFHAAVTDGEVVSTDATYATARVGPADTAATGVTPGIVGQNTGFSVHQLFFAFDTSTLPDWATITSATLSLFGVELGDHATTDFTCEARLHDWGASLTTADWVSGDDLGSKTLLATFNTTSYSQVAYNVFTSEAAFLANISKTGTTYIVVASSRQRLASQPSGTEYVHFELAEYTGTTRDPRLVVEVLA